MTIRQKLQIEASEKRQRINELLGKDEKTEQDHNELSDLTKRMQTLEIETRAAIVAEGEEEQRRLGEDPNTGDGESAELRSLFSRVSLNDYLAPASAGTGVDGASP